MGILSWIIFGALVGWLASLIMKRDAQMGALANIIVGIVGSFIGGWIGSTLGLGYTTGEFSIMGIIMGVVGASVLLFVIGLLTGSRR